MSTVDRRRLYLQSEHLLVLPVQDGQLGGFKVWKWPKKIQIDSLGQQPHDFGLAKESLVAAPGWEGLELLDWTQSPGCHAKPFTKFGRGHEIREPASARARM